MADSRRPARHWWWRRAGRWIAGPDGRSVGVLVLVPILAFVPIALAGHPPIAGDNVIQNFPLRVLTGQSLRAGQLPLWNPFVWSGSPLLGGLNAGSFYPTTFAFAVLPATAAWVLNLLVVYWAAGLGMYALVRQYRISPFASLLAAAIYAFSGAMTGQMVHLGVVQGWGWMPFVVLAQLRLGRSVLRARDERDPRGDGSSPWPWAVLLAAAVALILLTGEPRAIVELEIVAVVVGLWVTLRPDRHLRVRARLSYLGWSVLAAVWGVALAAAQLLPGFAFITSSQRSSLSYAFFASGSFPKTWTALLLVPDLFGGDGLLRMPTFFNSYNLPEVLGYVGLLPLTAALVLLTRSIGRRRDRQSGSWGLWLVLAALGLLLAMGQATPLGPVFHAVPLLGQTRLQSRNLGIVDLALAVMFAFWAERALSGQHEAAGTLGRRRWVAVAPPVAAAVLCLVAIAFPGPLESAFGVGSSSAGLGRYLTPWFLVQLVVAAAVVCLLVLWPRMLPSTRPRWLAVVIVFDLLVFSATSSTGLTAGHEIYFPNSRLAAAVLGTQGRFAVYDTTGVINLDDLSYIGQPDLNAAFTRLPSVQGYGSIVSNDYANATGSHVLTTLDACALQRGVFVPLRLHTLLTTTEFLVTELQAGHRLPQGQNAPSPVTAPESCPGAPAPGRPGARWWQLGKPVDVRSVTLRGGTAFGSIERRDPGLLSVGVLTTGGQRPVPVASVSDGRQGTTFVFSHPVVAVGVIAEAPRAPRAVASLSDDSFATDVSGNQLYFNGPLQDAMGQRAWEDAGMWREYVRFLHPHVSPPVWALGPSTGVHVAQLSTTPWGTEVDRVRSSRPVTVVRSEAYMSGWHARAVSAAGRTVEVSVYRAGLVQSVDLPAGNWTLTFSYRPGTLDPGVALSLIGVAGLAAVGVVAVFRRRRRSAVRGDWGAQPDEPPRSGRASVPARGEPR